MLFDREAQELLKKPFPTNQLQFRPGPTARDKSAAIPLTYIDQRQAADRLDEVLGPENWGCTYETEGDRVTCSITVKTSDGWLTKSNGAGDTDMEGTKGGYSDAFKRAAVLFGVGRYLYDMKLPWFPVEAKGKTVGFSRDTSNAIRAKIEEMSNGPCNVPEQQEEPEKGEFLNKTAAQREAKKFVQALGEVKSEEDLLHLLCENMTMLSKLNDMDEANKGKTNPHTNMPVVMWFKSNGKTHDFVGLYDRILDKAEEVCDYDARSRAAATMREWMTI